MASAAASALERVARGEGQGGFAALPVCRGAPRLYGERGRLGIRVPQVDEGAVEREGLVGLEQPSRQPVVDDVILQPYVGEAVDLGREAAARLPERFDRGKALLWGVHADAADELV